MIDLYRWEPNAGSLALLICLGEKGLDFNDRYVDVLGCDNLTDEYRRLDAGGAVPLLVVDGHVMPDAGIALQYLEEAYPEPGLAPADPRYWYDMQVWLAKVTGPTALASNVNRVGWHRHMRIALGEERLAAYRDGLAALPREKDSGWSAVQADAEAGEDPLENAEARIAGTLARVEARLAVADWLVGDAYSLADIFVFSIAHCLPRLLPSVVTAKNYPAVMCWRARIAARPAVVAALARRRPEFAEAAFRAS